MRRVLRCIYGICASLHFVADIRATSLPGSRAGPTLPGTSGALAIDSRRCPTTIFLVPLSLFAWLLAATYLCLEAIHRRRAGRPVCVADCTWQRVFLLAHLPEARPVKAPPAQGPLFAFHVTLNILAYSAFALSFVLSIIFLIQNGRLRAHKLGTVGWQFPALDVLERMTRSSVLIGCASLAAPA